MTTTTLPHSAAEAAAAFKNKTPFASVTLEAEKNPQRELQALAFRMMAIEMDGEWGIDEFRIACDVELAGDKERFTQREFESAESLAYVALKHGYARTIAKFPEAQRHTLEF